MIHSYSIDKNELLEKENLNEKMANEARRILSEKNEIKHL
jgi:hypothetical protein